MTLLYIDPCGGVAGDMLLGALLAAGAPEDALRDALASLPVKGYTLEVGTVRRCGLEARRVEVRPDDSVDHPHRHLSDVEAILAGATLPDRAADTARRVFRRLAEAEARVHGTTPEKVHFHEVGAVDAIVDIVGACSAVAMLGVERIECGPVPTGSGFVEAAHGRLPVPVPAVVELLTGVPTRASGEPGEQTTPTGAALVVTLARAFGPVPSMTIEAVGYGAGAREGTRGPNVTRVLVGRAAAADAAESDTAILLEANLDDQPGEELAAAAEACFEAGALDVWMTPVLMKKGRPGVVLACLAEPGRREAVEAAMFAHTTTFGVRRTEVARSKLARTRITVETPWGEVRVKVGRRDGQTVTAEPEFEDCRRRAAEAGMPVRTVMDAARAASREVRQVFRPRRAAPGRIHK